MVPIGETFSRFTRLAHDLGRELGKDIELVLTGSETELDKSMVEKITDSALHVVRNGDRPRHRAGRDAEASAAKRHRPLQLTPTTIRAAS